jgi:2-methylcitrate dehydratase PrpD
MGQVVDLTKAASARTGVSVTQQLAAFGASMTFERLPNEVVEKAKLCILDTLGCCIFGAALPSFEKLAAVVAAENCSPQATVFGHSLRTSASWAALLNGTSGHAFQFDEIHIESTLHPGPLAFPAVFALAERIDRASGRELITAMVAGYEVGLRIGLALKGGMFKSGFHNQGTTGVFVAAAAAARLLGLDVKQTVAALGIAASQAAGLMAVQDGAMTKSFHSGRAAQSGLYAALLAQQGYTGITDVLDGAYGTFFSAFVEDWSTEALTQDLGSNWKIMRVGFKPAPASNGSITAMTAIDSIMREHRLRADDIESVMAFVSDNTLHHCGWPYVPDRIQSVLSAQMNLRYGIAVMALDRQAEVEQFDEARIRDPEILKFIERIDVRHDPAFDAENGRFRVGCRLVVRSRSSTHEKTILYRRGSPEDPMTVDQLTAKFSALASRQHGLNVSQVAEALGEMDRLPNMTALAQLLRAEDC